MKKNCLFVLLIFICLFGFCNRVEAKDYTLEYSNDKDIEWINGICSESTDKFPCVATCENGGSNKIAINGSNSLEYAIENLEEYCDSGIKVTITKIKSIDDFRKYLASNNKVSGYFKKYCEKNSGNKLCSEFNSVQNNASVENGVYSCYANNLSWVGDDKNPSKNHPALTIEYDSNTDKFNIFPSGRSSTVQNFGNGFSDNGVEYYFYSIKTGESGFDTFKEKIIKKMKENNDGVCDGIFVFCPLREDTNKWYAEITTESSDKCEKISSQYYPITQSVGGSSSGEIDIQLSGTETSHAPGLIQEKVTIKTCSDLFKGDGDNTILLDILKILVGTVKVLVPVVLLVLGSIDFAKAIIAQDENGIKKAQSKFIKRLIIAVAIFLIPTIIKTLLDIAHSVWPDIISSSEDVFCGIL